MYKYLILTITIISTVAMCLWPDFHPEQEVFQQYYWQVDMLIHGGYYFVACMLILLLRFKIKPLHTGLAFFTFSLVLELLQNFSYHRSVSAMDIVSNLLGIGLAVGVFLKLSKTVNN